MTHAREEPDGGADCARVVRGATETLRGQWLLAQSIEFVIYPAVCDQLGWPMRPWMGKEGVPTHLARLSPQRPKYFRTEIEGGDVRKLLFYWIAQPQTATVTELAERRRTGCRPGACNVPGVHRL